MAYELTARIDIAEIWDLTGIAVLVRQIDGWIVCNTRALHLMYRGSTDEFHDCFPANIWSGEKCEVFPPCWADTVFCAKGIMFSLDFWVCYQALKVWIRAAIGDVVTSFNERSICNTVLRSPYPIYPVFLSNPMCTQRPKRNGRNMPRNFCTSVNAIDRMQKTRPTTKSTLPVILSELDCSYALELEDSTSSSESSTCHTVSNWKSFINCRNRGAHFSRLL